MLADYIEQETGIGLAICFLFFACPCIYFIGVLLIEKVLLLAWIILNKVIEIVKSVSMIVQSSKN